MAGVLAGVLASRSAEWPAIPKNETCASTGRAGRVLVIKGLLLSLLAGVLSAVYGIAINDVAKPIIVVAEHCGAG